MAGAGATAAKRFARLPERKLRQRVRSALQLLDWLWKHRSEEKVAAWLLANPDIVPGCRAEWQAAGHIHAMETYFGDLAHYMRRMTQPEATCPVCGTAVGHGERETSRYRAD